MNASSQSTKDIYAQYTQRNVLQIMYIYCTRQGTIIQSDVVFTMSDVLIKRLLDRKTYLIWPGQSGQLYMARAQWVVIYGQGKVGSIYSQGKVGSYIWSGQSGQLFLARAKWEVIFWPGQSGQLYMARAEWVVVYGQGILGSYIWPGQGGQYLQSGQSWQLYKVRAKWVVI